VRKMQPQSGLKNPLIVQSGGEVSETYDYLFKLIVIGDAATGKSCILHRFTQNKFKSDSTHTIGVEFGSRVIETGGKNLKLQVWDTAGQERFRSVTRSYYRGAAGCVLVYDISSRESFNHVLAWLNDARSLATSNLVICLVGNKTDLQNDREVTFLEASRFAQDNDIMFVETSAKNGENVEEAFVKVARSILQKIETGIIKVDDMSSGIQRGSAGGGAASTKIVKTKNPQLTTTSQTQDGGCSC